MRFRAMSEPAMPEVAPSPRLASRTRPVGRPRRMNDGSYLQKSRARTMPPRRQDAYRSFDDEG